MRGAHSFVARDREFVWHLPVSGPPINGKTFSGAVFRARSPGRGTTLSPLSERQRTLPFSCRRAILAWRARNCLCISESLIVYATSDYVLELFLSAYSIYVTLYSQDSFAPEFVFFFRLKFRHYYIIIESYMYIDFFLNKFLCYLHILLINEIN